MKIKLPYDLGWILLVIFIIFCIFEVLIGNFHHLWGYKTVAMLDVWSIEHILSGLSVGFLSMDIINKLFGLKLEEGIKLRKKHKNGLIDGLIDEFHLKIEKILGCFDLFGFVFTYVFGIFVGDLRTLFRSLNSLRKS